MNGVKVICGIQTFKHFLVSGVHRGTSGVQLPAGSARGSTGHLSGGVPGVRRLLV